MKSLCDGGRCQPDVRQQLVDVAGLVRWQSREHVLEIRVGVVAVEFGRLDEARDLSCALARQQCAGEQPIAASRCNLGVILPMSGKKSKSSTAGMRSMVAVFDGNTVNSERQVMLFTSKLHRA